MKLTKLKKMSEQKILKENRLSNDISYNLFKVCFTYNPYERMWYGCEAEHLNDLWNGVKNDKVYHAKNKDTLVSFFNEGKHLK